MFGIISNSMGVLRPDDSEQCSGGFGARIAARVLCWDILFRLPLRRAGWHHMAADVSQGVEVAAVRHRSSQLFVRKLHGTLT